MLHVEYKIGIITRLLGEEDGYDPDLYVVEVDVPGDNFSYTSFPKRNEPDEPRINDIVLLQAFDSTWHSYSLYERLKENKFIGIRSRGKQIKMDTDTISIGIFDPEEEYHNNETLESYKERELTSWIKIDKDGNLDIKMENNATINIEGNVTINVKGNVDAVIEGSVNAEVKNDASINVKGKTDLTSPNINISGPGTLTCAGTVVGEAGGGPFCAFPGGVAPQPGTPMMSGSKIMLK